VGSGPSRADVRESVSRGTDLRWAALGGVVGPAAFIATWCLASTVAPGYSATDDAISELAAAGADTRTLMTGGFIIFALCIFPYAWALRGTLGGRAWTAAAGTGIATLFVAAIPLGRSPASDHWHGMVAVCGYTSLAVTPLLAIRPLVARGQRGVAALSIATAAMSATMLLLSDATPLTGLFQRVGLTTGQAWIVCSSLAMVSGRLNSRSELIADRPVPANATVGADANG
jgi:hypothetical membrane protein